MLLNSFWIVVAGLEMIGLASAGRIALHRARDNAAILQSSKSGGRDLPLQPGLGRLLAATDNNSTADHHPARRRSLTTTAGENLRLFLHDEKPRR